MSVKDDLFQVEQGFWLAGKDHFRQHVDESCLLAFPQAGEMHGIFSNQQVAETVTSPTRWRDLTMSNRLLLEVTDDVAVISYRADVTRADGEPYSALISSGYVRRDGGWKLAFHQHSPV
ncbi:MAG: hypothetical protein A2790_02630 [Phenylobacterium sp. RIFCSPHIGHO2_01_FULL_69_31]|uniref:hypothetical protein n=1 Tax=Phenylobacterium sp. RIFCSPHIGHO2_01_FULL_69_31 TaxID=1801944 RepID=UPI0008CFCEE0|nr:hypothetical protein [Phenylobacterium sp. RIFCSPHIGHO2_01_FULL_69_31]OHB31730.1 MAG: hypothetical protein A2790_02630 [Phenylobacterium sp. RIFCSPHIGHO2_01_FULL_69_31]